MKDELISKVMDEVMKKMGASDATSAPAAACCNNGSANCNLTEFVGTAIGHTIGLVIANVDHQIHEKMDIDPKYRSIGIIGDRTGAGPQIFAADEAVKATNCEIVKIELPRDTEGGAGHGSLIIFGAEDVSDARRAVEVCLREVERTMGDVYGSPAGHLEFQYTARASHALNKAFGAPIGKAFGITVGAPRRLRRRQAGHHRRPRCGHAGAEDPGAQRGAQVHHHPLYSVIAGKESDSYEVKTF